MGISSPEEGKPSIEPRASSTAQEQASAEAIKTQAQAAAAAQFRDPPQWTQQFSFTDERKQQIVDMVRLDAETDLEAMKPFLARVQEIIALYEQERDPKGGAYEGASNVSAGDVPIAVENMHPRLFGAVSTDPLAFFRAENRPSKRNLPNIQSFMNWVFRSDMPDLMNTLDEHVHSTILLGTQPVWVRWEKIRNTFWDFSEAGANQDTLEPGAPQPEILTRQVEIIERGCIQNLALEDFIVPITEGREIQAMSHCIRAYYLTAEEIRDNVARKIFSPVDEGLLNIGVDDLIAKDSSEEMARLRQAGFNAPQLRSRKRLRIYEWHGRYDADNEGFRSECVFTIVPELKLYLSGRYQPSPDGLRPFEVTWLVPRKNFFYGIGVPEMIRQLAKERDAIHNQRVDAGAVSIIPFGFYRAASGFKPDKITLSPGTMIPLDDINDATFANFSNPATILASEEAMTQAQIEKLSIAGSFQLGRESEIFKSRATASGTQLVVGQGNIRFNLLGERVKRSVARILGRVTTLYQRFLVPGTSEKVLGSDGKDLFPKGLSRGDLRGKFSAFLTGDTETANVSVARQVATMLYQGLLQNPLVARSPARVWEITAQWIRSFSRDPEPIIGKRPPDPDSFVDVVRGMIESIEQGYAPEIQPNDDLIGIITGLNVYKQSREFQSLELPRQGLVDKAIEMARTLLVQQVTRMMQQGAQQGEGGQPQPGPQQPTMVGEQEVPADQMGAMQ